MFVKEQFYLIKESLTEFGNQFEPQPNQEFIDLQQQIKTYWKKINQNYHNSNAYWTPGLGRKGLIKQGPPVRPSVSFLSIGLLVFSETSHVRGPYIVVCDRAGFFGIFFPSDKNDPKTWFLDFLRTSCHQFCLECV